MKQAIILTCLTVAIICTGTISISAQGNLSGRFCGEPGLTGTYLRNRLLSGSRKRAQVCQLEFDMA